jgi:DNA-binding MarR family transcriptional regulator
LSFFLDEAIGFVAERTVRALRRALKNAFRDSGFDITPYQFIVLCRLWEEEGLSQVDLARRTVIDMPTLTRMLDVMERRELLYRARDDTDKRRSRLHLTPAGRALEQSLPSVAERHLARATSGISETDLMKTRNTLRRVRRNLEGRPKTTHATSPQERTPQKGPARKTP